MYNLHSSATMYIVNVNPGASVEVGLNTCPINEYPLKAPTFIGFVSSNPSSSSNHVPSYFLLKLNLKPAKRYREWLVRQDYKFAVVVLTTRVYTYFRWKLDDRETLP